MLVVAYALAGRMDTDLSTEPLGHDASGQPIYLDKIRPTMEAIDALVSQHVKKEFYRDQYSRIFDGDAFWKALEITDGRKVAFKVTARLDTEVDLDYFSHGGILPYVLRKLVG
jgi:aconitate hydratase